MPHGLCDGVEAVRKKTREMLRAGADVIKVHATGEYHPQPIILILHNSH